MRFIQKSAFLTAAISFLVAPFAVSAQLSGPLVPCEGINCTVCDLAELGQNLLNGGIFLSVFITGVIFAYAGFLLLTSATNPGQRSKAKGMFGKSALGLVVVLSAWLIVDTLLKTLLGGDFGPWNAICSI